MSLTDSARKALVDLLGEEYVTSDPVLTQAYSRCFTSMEASAPDCVALPGSAEDIQEIFRLANIHDFKVIPTGTHLISHCEPLIKKYDYLIIDPKRMDKLWIDPENMYAVVEPYVTFARLQVEAMSRGLTCYVPTGGSQTSVVANLTFQGFNLQAHRFGAGSRSMLAMEWVMPTGEMINIGSISQPDGEFFWGEGPGPDLRGMIKGVWGMAGGLGMCTRAGIKLLPWPGPELLPTRGPTPDKRVYLPEDRFRVFAIDFADLKSMKDAMYEIGRCEIASRLVHLRKGWYPAEVSLAQEDFWDMWESDEYQQAFNNLVVVVLETQTTVKQLDYEEDVLMEIVGEYGGRFLGGEMLEKVATIVVPDLMIRPNLIFRGFRVAGSFLSVKMTLDSLDHAVMAHEGAAPLVDRYMKNKIPPFLDTEGESGYMTTYDFTHMGYYELPILYEAGGESVKAARMLLALQVLWDIKARAHTGGFITGFIINFLGPLMGRFDRIIRDVKTTFDPNCVSNPPWPMPLWLNLIRGSLRNAVTSAKTNWELRRAMTE